MKITIEDKEITLKYTMRALIMYENITEKSFDLKGYSDIITFFYCIVVSTTKDYTLSFDTFLDWIDDNPGVVNEFSEFIRESLTVNNQFKKN